MWTYLSWPDLDRNLLLEHFNVTYKYVTKYVLPVILNVSIFFSSSHLYVRNCNNWSINEFAQIKSRLFND